jgi:hypothetical protein
MIRPFTLITMVLAAVSGAYLFAVKHRAQVLDDQLAGIAQHIQMDQARIVVLKAQWSLETAPARLSGLAGQFTALQPMKPAQLVTLAALPGLLPAAVLPAAGAPAIAAVAPAPAGAAPAARVAAALPLPLPPPPAPPQASAVPPPARLAVAAAVRAVPARPAGRAVGSSLHMASTRLAEELAPPSPLYARPGAVLAAAPRYAAPGGLASGSALGMAADLAAPQPLAPGVGN